jgi:hypothetical protein
MGTTANFFFKYKASAGASNPAPNKTPFEDAMLNKKASSPTG